MWKKNRSKQACSSPFVADYVNWSHRYDDIISVKTANNKPSKQTKHCRYSWLAIRELLKFVRYDQPLKAHIQLRLSCNDTYFVHIMAIIDLALSIWGWTATILSKRMAYIICLDLIVITQWRILCSVWLPTPDTSIGSDVGANMWISLSSLVWVATNIGRTHYRLFLCKYYLGMFLCHL